MAKKPIAKSSKVHKENKRLRKAKRDYQPRAGGTSSAHAA